MLPHKYISRQTSGMMMINSALFVDYIATQSHLALSLVCLVVVVKQIHVSGVDALMSPALLKTHPIIRQNLVKSDVCDIKLTTTYWR